MQHLWVLILFARGSNCPENSRILAEYHKHLVLLKCEYLKVIFISLLDFYHHIKIANLQNSKLLYNFSDKLHHILNTNNIVNSHKFVLNNSKILYRHNKSIFYFFLRSENVNFPYPDSAQKLPTPLT